MRVDQPRCDAGEARKCAVHCVVSQDLQPRSSLQQLAEPDQRGLITVQAQAGTAAVTACRLHRRTGMYLAVDAVARGGGD